MNLIETLEKEEIARLGKTIAEFFRYNKQFRFETGTHYTDEAITAAVELSARYIGDRFLPDKAIDLIDEAASRLRIEIDPAPRDELAGDAGASRIRATTGHANSHRDLQRKSTSERISSFRPHNPASRDSRSAGDRGGARAPDPRQTRTGSGWAS